ncbi:glycosyltransferase involved in cell wall biosynthesis [Roseimicrobium gellanilyticum]|uniref:Glycosyltransferase involved in cell wall biosynthesis n=1 Tax=Roseimicrobium gellanilyticum TaxID=748857 RepID=A0A366HX40_9BACT|nr:glycosyltransferase [Roseimicrobium gellanilyticum]RBP48134.1 glycosyltransferase involved in cell wall biosynthesis [Roseimicrobium gellanilyticum]
MARPVRLLEVVDSLQPGGMENVLVQVLSRYAPEQVSADVVCLVRSGPFEERLPSRTKVHVIGKKDGFDWKTVSSMRELIRRGGYDVVHTHHLGGLIFFSLACGMRKRPVLIHSEHTIWTGSDLSRKKRWQRRMLYPIASAVTTVSQQQVDQMQALGFRHRQMFPIVNGVDSARFCPAVDKVAVRRQLNLNPQARWLGMVARFGPWKRHLDLIEAFEGMAQDQSHVNLLLVGDGGPEKERVLARLETSRFRDRIHWAGFQLDPVPWYQAMDALVVSSSNEGMPNAVLEAMSCGLPMMANDVCGVREIAEDEKHGWIMDLGSVPKLEAGLRLAAVAAEQELASRGRAARLHVQNQFSMDATVGKYFDLFCQSIGKTNKTLPG